MNKDLEVISIFGGRGSGKTTKARELLADRKRKRVIVYDLKDEYQLQKVYGLAEFAKFMRLNWYKNFKISYVPAAKEKNEHISELSKLCYALANAQQQDSKQGKGANLTILVEEMSVSAPNQKYKEGQGGFEYCVNIAREWGIEIIGVSQRPAQANPDYRGNSSKTYFFALWDALDIKAAQEKLGDKAQSLKSLKPHDFILCDQGQIKTGKNKL